MTDGGNNDPEGRDPTANWWQGAPGRRAADPTTRQPFMPPAGPNPYVPGQNPQVAGSTPHASGPNPQGSVANPYVSGANPYASVPNPQVSGAIPHSTGPAPYQSAPPPGAPYAGYGGPPPSGGGNGRVWLYAGIGALVVIVVAVVAIVLVNGNSGPNVVPTTTASATSSSHPSATTSTSTRPSTPAAVIPGYQVVVPSAANAAWDVPQDWTIDQSTSNFGTGTDQVPVAGLATEGDQYCPGYVRTNMFLSVSQQADTAAAAADIGARMAKIGWETRTSMTATTPEPFDNSDHSLHGVFVETKGNFTPPDPRCASTYSIYTYAVGGGTSGALVLTIAADTGVDRSVNLEFARRLLATFRLF
ncbi:hypothetical protein AB0N05_28575 [Nocardia sp. NPDC051030]|uniref:hypothetical protein n=1 Tax=Nocardia sp. NPDC051030 TaxID=3155162 RepID=UPI00343B1627